MHALGFVQPTASIAALSELSLPIISRCRMRFLAKLSLFCDLLLKRFALLE